MGVSVFIGARLMNIAVNFDWYAENPARAWAFSATGFSLYGGVLAAVITGGLIALWRRIPLLKFADTVTPFTGIGIALMRVGCFLNGCCFGKETDMPWGVIYPPFSPAHVHQISGDLLGGMEVHPVHPTQIYELIAALACAALAFYLIKNKKPHGTAFLYCGILFSAFRLVNMNLRELPYDETTLSTWYPLLYFSVIAACALALLYITKKSGQTETSF